MSNNYTTNKTYNVCIYVRLSQADKKENGRKYESDSESIKNQRELLNNVVKDFQEREKNNIINFVGEYVDDGYTGTNFNRPKFQKMIKDIENKKINFVIVKDLSRLGRDHTGTGMYAETYFLEHNVRLYSKLEDYDTTDPNRQSIQFILAANDYYSEQNSRKIRDILDNKRRNGHFIGSNPCFGYMRDPERKGHLIPDPDTAYIVKEIFTMKDQNIGVSDITSYLNEKGYPTPSAYKDIKYSARLRNKEQWSISSVKKILSNRMYVGDMVQHVQTKINYKSEKKVLVPEDEWIIVENTHEPLVSRETFNLIQEHIHDKVKSTKPTSSRPIRLYEGLLYCKECGNRLTVGYRKKANTWSVNCNKYSRDPRRRLCEPHYFPYNYLEQQLIMQIEKNVSQYIKKIGVEALNDDIVKRSHKNLSELELEIKELDNEKEKLSKRLFQAYNDQCDGKIPASVYTDLAKSFDKESKRLEEEKSNLENECDVLKSNAKNVPDYTKQIKKLLNLKNQKESCY